MDISSHK